MKDKMYYLDTNVIIQLSNGLNNPVIKKTSFTSSLVIYELIKSFKNNYNRTKKILDNIHYAQLFIDWRGSLFVIEQAFGFEYKGNIEKRNDMKLRTLYDSIINSESYEEMKRQLLYRLKKDKRCNYYDFFNSGIEYIDWVLDFYDKWFNSIQLLTDKIMNMQLKINSHIKFIDSNNEVLYHYLLFTYSSIVKHLQDAGRGQLVPDIVDHHLDKLMLIKRNYNNNLDVLLQIQLNMIRNLSNYNLKTNDGFDITHFYFIKKNQVIVTDDNFIHKLSKNCVDSNVIKYVKYKEIVNIP